MPWEIALGKLGGSLNRVLALPCRKDEGRLYSKARESTIPQGKSTCVHGVDPMPTAHRISIKACVGCICLAAAMASHAAPQDGRDVLTVNAHRIAEVGLEVRQAIEPIICRLRITSDTGGWIDPAAGAEAILVTARSNPGRLISVVVEDLPFGYHMLSPRMREAISRRVNGPPEQVYESSIARLLSDITNIARESDPDLALAIADLPLEGPGIANRFSSRHYDDLLAGMNGLLQTGRGRILSGRISSTADIRDSFPFTLSTAADRPSVLRFNGKWWIVRRSPTSVTIGLDSGESGSQEIVGFGDPDDQRQFNGSESQETVLGSVADLIDESEIEDRPIVESERIGLDGSDGEGSTESDGGSATKPFHGGAAGSSAASGGTGGSAGLGGGVWNYDQEVDPAQVPFASEGDSGPAASNGPVDFPPGGSGGTGESGETDSPGEQATGTSGEANAGGNDGGVVDEEDSSEDAADGNSSDSNASEGEANNEDHPNPTLETIRPAQSWDGTLDWAGRAPPSPTGSIAQHEAVPPSLAFCVPPHGVANPRTLVGVVGDSHELTGISHVEFWCEGSVVSVTDVSRHGDPEVVAYWIEVDTSSPDVNIGTAEIYATARTASGRVRTIGPVRIDTYSPTAQASRPRFLLSEFGDFDSLNSALCYAPSGAIIEMDAGDYLYGTAPLNNHNEKLIELQPRPGVGRGEIVFHNRGGNRTDLTRLRAQRFSIREATFELDDVSIFYGMPEAVQIVQDCDLTDRRGLTGPPQGYAIVDGQIEAWQQVWRTFDDQRTCFIGCQFSNYCTAGGWLYVDCDLSASADLLAFGGWQDGAAVIDTRGVQPCEFKQRLHAAASLSVVSATFDPAENETRIIVDANGSIANRSWHDEFARVEVISGVLNGSASLLVGQSDSLRTVVASGDLSALNPGDAIWTYTIWHADSLQVLQSESPLENVVISGYEAIGLTSQPMLIQPGPAGYLSGLAIQRSNFVMTGGGPYLGQIQGFTQGLVIRQSNILGTKLVLRTDAAGFGLRDCLFVDSVFKSFTGVNGGNGGVPEGDNGVPLGPGVFTVHNCHFEDWVNVATNIFDGRVGTQASGPGPAMLDGNFRPLPSSPLLNRGGEPGSCMWDLDAELFGPDFPIGARREAALPY